MTRASTALPGGMFLYPPRSRLSATVSGVVVCLTWRAVPAIFGRGMKRSRDAATRLIVVAMEMAAAQQSAVRPGEAHGRVRSRSPSLPTSRGSVIVKTAPPWLALSADTLPPWLCTIACTIERPRPLPEGIVVPDRDASAL